MGSESASTVYAAELQGILMALQIAYTETTQNPVLRHKEIVIFTNNQAAIRSVQDPRWQSGQYILWQIINILGDIWEKAPEMKVRISWIPAHEGVMGNKAAD